MKKTLVLTLFCLLAGLSSQALALNAPQVVSGPENPMNNVLQIQVDRAGDFAWMEIPFGTTVSPGYDNQELLIVSFDLYRPYDSSQEWFYWSWTSNGDDPIDPDHGGQDQRGTFPFVGTVTTGQGENVFDRWVNVEMVWEFFETPQPYVSDEYTGDIHGYVYSYYDDSAIDIAFPLILNNDNPLTGYFFGLMGFSSESDLVYLDNLWIEGVDHMGNGHSIYESDGFEGLNQGDLDGQGGWRTSAYSPSVPLPSSFPILALGLVGLVGLKRSRS